MMTVHKSSPPFKQADHAGQWLREQLGADAHITLDSRQIARGDGFIAAPGLTVDGRQFVGDAVARGAAAVLQHADSDSVEDAPDIDQASVPTHAMVGLADCAGEVAAAFYAHPSQALTVVAITGTNGKTSCANWVASGAGSLVGATGATAAAIGTLGVSRFEQGPATAAASVETTANSTLTTPDAVSMQRVLAELAQSGVSLVAIEASSIGLDQNRLGGVQIDVAVFTNLTHDHLDYHGTMSAYQQAKALLFSRPELKTAIVCGDDPAAAAMLAAVPTGVRTITYGLKPERFGALANESVTLAEISAGPVQTLLSLTGDLGEAKAQVSVTGRFNAINATAVWTTWRSLGLSVSEANLQLSELQAVNGRMQALNEPGAPLVVIDYAHTPDALAAVLAALTDQRKTRGGELWCVFGCGGDRDTGKRVPMAQVAQAGATRVVLTSDNPRSESPELILEQMRAGLTCEPWRVDVDRRRAIEAAVLAAGENDIVLIAGKGHEAWQEIAGVKHPFSDEAVSRDALRLRRSNVAGGAGV